MIEMLLARGRGMTLTTGAPRSPLRTLLPALPGAGVPARLSRTCRRGGAAELECSKPRRGSIAP